VKKLFIFLLFTSVISCNDNSNELNKFLPDVQVNKTIFLNNPEFINLQIPFSPVVTNTGGISGIIIVNTGRDLYVAFERSAPHLTPQPCSIMKVNNLVMECDCDDSKFSLLDGAPMTDGINLPAKQYRVLVTGPDTLQIVNF